MFPGYQVTVDDQVGGLVAFVLDDATRIFDIAHDVMGAGDLAVGKHRRVGAEQPQAVADRADLQPIYR